MLIELINSMLSKKDQAQDIILLNPYNPKNFRGSKLSILDIKAKSVDGRRFNVEIQVSDEADYDKRALYYWAKLYTEQLQRGEDYLQLSKAIGIHILNFTSILESNKYHNIFYIKEKDTGFHYFKELELHTVELTKFSTEQDNELTSILKKIKTSLDIWLTFLTRHDLLNKDNLPKEMDNEKLKKALTVLEIMNFNEEEREAYEGHLKWLMVEANTLGKYEQKGFDKGVAEGIEKGRIEERKLIADNLLKNGLSIKDIAKATSLTVDDIKSIYSDL